MYYVCAMKETDTLENKLRFVALADAKYHGAFTIPEARTIRDNLQKNADAKKFPLDYKIVHFICDIVE